MSSNAQLPASGEPSKVSGQFHSVKGTVVEAVGNVTGATSWQHSGKEEHAAGEVEYNAAKAVAYVEGTGDRLEGKKNVVIGALTGDRVQEGKGNIQHDSGKAQQELNSF